MNNIKQLGERIREERKRLGITQRDLALAAGTGLRFVVDVENGKETAQIGKVMGLLQAMGLELEVRHRS